MYEYEPLHTEPQRTPVSPSYLRTGSTLEPRSVKSLHDHAGWLKTVGFCGVVNAILAIVGIKLRFIFTLAVVDICSYAAVSLDSMIVGTLVALTVAGIACAGCYFLAAMGRRGYGWAFKAAGAVYLVDLLLWMATGNWVEVVAHAFVLYQLHLGAKLCKKINR